MNKKLILKRILGIIIIFNMVGLLVYYGSDQHENMTYIESCLIGVLVCIILALLGFILFGIIAFLMWCFDID